MEPTINRIHYLVIRLAAISDPGFYGNRCDNGFPERFRGGVELMSQEVLFLIFLALEAVMLVGIYQIFLLKMIRKAVVRHWIEEIESGRIDLPSVLETYTQSLLVNIDAMLFGYDDGTTDGRKTKGKVQKFYEGAAGAAAKSMKGDPAGIAANMLNELSDEPWYVQMIAQKLLPSLQNATENLQTPSSEPELAKYQPGLAKR